MVRVELYRKPSCPACDDTRTMLDRLRVELPFELVEVDVTRDPEMRRRWERDVPVLFVDGRRSLSGDGAEEDVRRRLERRATATGSRAAESRRAPPRRVHRAKAALSLLALAALAAIIAWKAFEIAATRPRVVKQSPYDAFGIEPANVPAPPLELAAMNGARFSLAEARGQVVFVNFWATWCPPCRQEMPSMLQLGREIAARHPGRFKMVAVSVDEGWGPIREFFAEPPFQGVPPDLTVALDEGQTATRAYYCTARGVCPDLKFPETYIVDGSGRLVAYVVGPRDWSSPAVRAFLEQLIGS